MIDIIWEVGEEYAPIVWSGLVKFFNFDLAFAIVVSLGFALHQTVFPEPLLALVLVIAMLVKIMFSGNRVDSFTHVRPLLMPLKYRYNEGYITKASQIKIVTFASVMSLWIEVLFFCCVHPNRQINWFELIMIFLIPIDFVYACCVIFSEGKYISLLKLRNKRDEEEPQE